MIPHTDTGELKALGELFTNYLNFEESPVTAIGISTTQDDGTEIPWLSQGLKALSLGVPFKAFTPIDPIKSISIQDLALAFTEQDPWNPTSTSNSVQAQMRRRYFIFLSR